MPPNEKPAPLAGGGLSNFVRLQAERGEDSADSEAKQARRERLWASIRAGRGTPVAEIVWHRLKLDGPTTIGELQKSLAAHGLSYSGDEVRGRVNSLLRRKMILDTGDRRPGRSGRDAVIWRVAPDVDLKAPTGGAPEVLGVELKGRRFHLAIYRPRVSDGVMRPSSQGFILPVDCLSDLIAALHGVEAEARATGLIGGGA